MIQIASNGPEIALSLKNEPPAIRRAMVRAMKEIAALKATLAAAKARGCF